MFHSVFCILLICSQFLSRCCLRPWPGKLQTLSISSPPSWHQVNFHSTGSFWKSSFPFPMGSSHSSRPKIVSQSMPFALSALTDPYVSPALLWLLHRSPLSCQLRLASLSVRWHQSTLSRTSWSSSSLKLCHRHVIRHQGVIGGWMTGWFNCLGAVFFLIFFIPDIGTRQGFPFESSNVAWEGIHSVSNLSPLRTRYICLGVVPFLVFLILKIGKHLVSNQIKWG